MNKMIQLTPDTLGGEALRRIGREQLARIQANEAGVMAGQDPEAMHDYRVAIRRTRTALAQLGKAFPKKVTRRFAAEFRRFGRLTGPKRDLDVFLEQLDEMTTTLPQAYQPGVAAVRRGLVERQAAELVIVQAMLSSPDYREFMESWTVILADGVVEGKTAARPAIDVARKRIWRQFNRVQHRAADIKPDSPAADIHELRISGKKLRYLLEFFAALFPEAALQTLIASLKELQDILGDFQDLVVQEALLEELMESGPDDGALVESAGFLRLMILDQQVVARREIAAEAAVFALPEIRQRYHIVIGPQPT